MNASRTLSPRYWKVLPSGNAAGHIPKPTIAFHLDLLFDGGNCRCGSKFLLIPRAESSGSGTWQQTLMVMPLHQQNLLTFLTIKAEQLGYQLIFPTFPSCSRIFQIYRATNLHLLKRTPQSPQINSTTHPLAPAARKRSLHGRQIQSFR